MPPVITIYAIDARHVALRFDRHPTSADRAVLRQCLAQHGKFRHANPFLVTKYRRFKHIVRELTRMGYPVEVQPPLVDPRTATMVEMVDDVAEDVMP